MANTDTTTAPEAPAGETPLMDAATDAQALEALGVTPETQETQTEPEQGKGSKSAVLADLATERDKRQATEAKLDAVLSALGLQQADDDPAQAAQAAADDARQARVELAVYRNAATHGADPDALLDSAAFLRSLDGVDPTDTAAVTAAIQAATEGNPRLRLNNPAAGARDAAAGNRSTTNDADTEALRVLGF